MVDLHASRRDVPSSVYSNCKADKISGIMSYGSMLGNQGLNFWRSFVHALSFSAGPARDQGVK
jgi:hypothetical protein